jgi:prophage regulatory protein
MAIWRIDRCVAEAGYRSNTSIYNLIRDGLWTEAVALGKRSVGWPEDEVRALCSARIAGMAEDELRQFVCYLHEQRSTLLSEDWRVKI